MMSDGEAERIIGSQVKRAPRGTQRRAHHHHARQASHSTTVPHPWLHCPNLGWMFMRNPCRHTI